MSGRVTIISAAGRLRVSGQSAVRRFSKELCTSGKDGRRVFLGMC